MGDVQGCTNVAGAGYTGATASNDTTGTSTTIQGSNLQADDTISIDTGTLDILASRDTLKIKRESEQAHITAQITIYGAAGGASISGDYSRSKDGESHATFNNSNLTANTMNITTSEDMTIRGGNVHANDHLAVDVGGDLTVESVQNRSRTENNSMGVSDGISLGGTADSSTTNSSGQAVHQVQGINDVGGLAGVNGGINASNGMSVTRSTVLSSLTSGGTATVTVDGATQITGALLATIDDEGNDLGNLNLTTGSLNFTDLRNTDISSQTSAAISTNVSVGGSAANTPDTTTALNNEGDDLEFNTTNISYSNNSTYAASNTMATLGQGNITVGGVQLEENGELTEAGEGDSVLAGVNRDTSNVTNELWDIERQEGNVELTVDHRTLSEEGRTRINNEFGNFGGNIQLIVQDVPSASGGNAIENAIGAALNVLGDKSFGLIPSEENAGGLLANLPVMVGASDNQHQVMLLRPADDPLVLSGDYEFVDISTVAGYDDLPELSRTAIEGMMVSYDADINFNTVTDQNFVNGMLNSSLESIVNGVQQTGSGEFNIAYNPTHGVFGDLFESLVDKVFGNSIIHTGIAGQTGNYIATSIDFRMEQYLEAGGLSGGDAPLINIAAHSQGNLLVNAGLHSLGVGSFSELGQIATGVTVASYGSPVANATMEETINSFGFTYGSSDSNAGDAVAEGLGGNQGLSVFGGDPADVTEPLSLFDSLVHGISGASNLLGDKYREYDDTGEQTNVGNVSPHSTYECTTQANVCGNRNFTWRENSNANN